VVEGRACGGGPGVGREVMGSASLTHPTAGLFEGNLYVTCRDDRVRYYLGEDGRSPFEEWFSDLHEAAAAKVAVALARLEAGNVSNAQSVAEGVMEYRID
jgi:hypothetical protein